MLEFLGTGVVAFIIVMMVSDLLYMVCDFIGFCKRNDYND